MLHDMQLNRLHLSQQHMRNQLLSSKSLSIQLLVLDNEIATNQSKMLKPVYVAEFGNCICNRMNANRKHTTKTRKKKMINKQGKMGNNKMVLSFMKEKYAKMK